MTCKIKRINGKYIKRIETYMMSYTTSWPTGEIPVRWMSYLNFDGLEHNINNSICNN